MFSLLRTMETLGWVVKDAGERYVLGAGISYYNTVYNDSLKQNMNLVERFLAESVQSVGAVGRPFSCRCWTAMRLFTWPSRRGSPW